MRTDMGEKSFVCGICVKKLSESGEGVWYLKKAHANTF